MSLVKQYNDFCENFRKMKIENEDGTGRLYWGNNWQKSLKKMTIVAKINENTKLFREIKQKKKTVFCEYPKLKKGIFMLKLEM